VSALCSRVVIIDHGRVVAEDTPDNLTRAVRGGERLILDVEGPPAAVAGCLRAVPGVAGVETVDGRRQTVDGSPDMSDDGSLTAPSPTSPLPSDYRGPSTVSRLILQTAPGDESFARGVRRAVSGAVVTAGFGLLELRAERLSLEDIFVRLVTAEVA
jgi:ABC-2 type transport system ATP-binding protein